MTFLLGLFNLLVDSSLFLLLDIGLAFVLFVLDPLLRSLYPLVPRFAALLFQFVFALN